MYNGFAVYKAVLMRGASGARGALPLRPSGIGPRRSADSGPFDFQFKNAGRTAIGAFITIGPGRNIPLTAASDAAFLIHSGGIRRRSFDGSIRK